MEREFLLAPWFRRWEQRLVLSSSRLRFRRARATEIDFDHLPPDTYIIYPDRLGNCYVPEMRQVRPTAVREAFFTAQPVLPDALQAANLDYFLRQEVEAAEDLPRMDEEEGWTQGPAEIPEDTRDPLTAPERRFSRPALGYVAAGLVGVVAVMFAIPALRRPASSMLPKGMAEASRAAITRPVGVAADAKPAYSITSKQDWANAARPPYNLRRSLRAEQPAVLVHHYDEAARMVRTDSGIKRYSDRP